MASEKPNDVKKLIEKMRTRTDQDNRKTDGAPVRRFRRKMQKVKSTASAVKPAVPENADGAAS